MKNSGNVDLEFNWKVDMDAGYPARLPESSTRPSSLRPRSKKSYDSRPSSRSLGGILYPVEKKPNMQADDSRNHRGDEFLGMKVTNECRPIESRGWSMRINPKS